MLLNRCLRVCCGCCWRGRFRLTPRSNTSPRRLPTGSLLVITRGHLSKDVIRHIQSFPKDMHPMVQLSSALLYLQPQSHFNKAYQQGVHKSKYWEHTYEDALDLVAKIPRLAAYIFRHTYKDSLIAPREDLDLAGNYAHMMGFDSFEFRECLRGYQLYFLIIPKVFNHPHWPRRRKRERPRYQTSRQCPFRPLPELQCRTERTGWASPRTRQPRSYFN